MNHWKRAIAGCCLCWLGLCTVADAGIRGAGRYCGVVVFDRWGGCTLYSGIYLMYVSEKVKQDLRDQEGKAVEIQAMRVYQPMNPGDGRIDQLEYLGPAPGPKHAEKLDGLRLATSVEVGKDGGPVGVMVLKNIGDSAINIRSGDLALTLLMKRQNPRQGFAVSDGPSFALITRQNFEIGGDTPRWHAEGVENSVPFSWTIGKENALPQTFVLEPGGKKELRLHFEVPDGEYEFLCGYGGGVHEHQCIASNLTPFDVTNGKATVASIQRR